MNPLCCIAPATVHGDRNSTAASKPLNGKLEADSLIRNANFVSRPRLSADAAFHEATELRDSKPCSFFACRNSGPTTVGGILYKWVNYGKRWRARWFLLEDGVLSYYKVHGPDKIVMNQRTEDTVKVIGYASRKYLMQSSWTGARLAGPVKRWKPFGEMHLKVSSIHASKSDIRRLSIFTGTKMLHLQCLSREDRTAWLEALLAAKDISPPVLSSTDFNFPEDVIVSTEKLRLRLQHEEIAETVIKDCESIVLLELSDLQQKLNSLQRSHLKLLDVLRLVEKERIELEATVVDGTKERMSCCDQVDRRLSDFYSIVLDGSGSESELDNNIQEVGIEADDEDGIFFDTNDFLWSDLRSASYRSGNVAASVLSSFYEKDNLFRTILYPGIERRRDFPEPKEKEKPVGLWSIIKDNIGKDLSGVCLPVYFNEPLSSLQKCFEDLEYSYLIDQALEFGKQGNDLMRILNVAAFAISGYASTGGRQCKPFNPLLGETYEADYPDKGLRFFSEKVSHHPMIVACHCEGRGWKFWADSKLKGKFWGRSIQIDPVGVLNLQFDDGEMFQWSKVTTSIYNIIIGKIYCDHYGTMRIKGSGRYSCKLKFKEQSIIDRNSHQVHGFVQDNKTGGKVAVLLGKWDDAIYYVLGDPTMKSKGYDPMTEAVLLWERGRSLTKTRYNLTPFAISLNELLPGLLEKLPPTDSRLRPDQRHLENGEFELADAEKLRLEKLQRQARKLQESGWEPRWFRRDEDGCYHYKGGYWEAREKGDWGAIPNIFQHDPSYDISLPAVE